MKARAFFWLALISSVVTAGVFTGGWIGNDLEATTGENLLRQGQLDFYDYEQGWVGHEAVPESRALSLDYLFLLKIVPASILAVWFVASWIVWGPSAFRLQTLKSHFLALKK